MTDNNLRRNIIIFGDINQIIINCIVLAIVINEYFSPCHL